MVKWDANPEALQEAVTILHEAAHSVLRDIDRRFQHTGLVPDLVALFNAHVKYDAQGTCERLDGVLNRVAAHFQESAGVFKTSWKQLQQYKEVQIKKEEKAGNHRQNMKIEMLWPHVLLNMTGESKAGTAAAWKALNLLLALEATNAGVERDAGLKRRLKEVMQGLGKAETVDSRLRVLQDGPVLKTAKNNLGVHPKLYEAAQDFLCVAKRHMGPAKDRKPSQPQLFNTWSEFVRSAVFWQACVLEASRSVPIKVGTNVCGTQSCSVQSCFFQSSWTAERTTNWHSHQKQSS